MSLSQAKRIPIKMYDVIPDGLFVHLIALTKLVDCPHDIFPHLV